MVHVATRVPIIVAKLHPPTVPARVIYPAKHQALAEKVLGRRLTSIVAPGGYGKTTFLAQLAKRLGPERRVAWYTLGEMDADPAVFLAHLLATVEAAAPGSTEQAAQVLRSVADASREAHLVTAALCEELWRRPGAPGDRGPAGGTTDGHRVLIILDDYHLVLGTAAINAAVQFLFANLPPGFSIALAGRERPPLATGRLGLSEQYLGVGPADLSFEAADVKAYLNDVCGLGLDDGQVAALATATEGWPAGLVLATQAIAINPGPELKKALTAFGGRHDAVFAYFSSEVLGRLGDDDCEFLMAAANLRYLTAEACTAVLGVDRPGERLDGLVREGLFLTATEAGEERVYRFHPLFRDALTAAQKRYSEPEALRRLHLRAAEHYEAAGHFDAAMEHLLAAGNPGAAGALLRRRGDEVIARGYVDEMRYWLKALPRELVDGDPYLLYYMGFVHQHSDQAMAIDYLERAADRLGELGDLRRQVRALIYMATIYSLQNRVDKVRETAGRIPALKALSRDPWARGVLVVAALTQAAWDDKLRRGVWLSRISRHLPLDDDWLWAMLAYSCMVYYRLGDLKLARRVITEALAMNVVRTNDVWLGLALVLYHVVLYSEDDQETGEKIREQLWDLGERYDSAYYKAYAQRAMAHARWHHGGREEARELFLSSQYFFERTGNQAMAMISRLDRALLEAEAGAARETFAEAQEAYHELLGLDSGQGLVELGQTLFGAVAREAGELELAEKLLLASAKVSRGKGSKQMLAGTSLHLAHLYTDKGDDAAADEHLRTALQTAEGQSYVLFWDLYIPTILKMGLRAIERQVHPAYAERLLAYWLGAEATRPGPGGTRPGPGEARHQIEVSLFGDLLVRVSGVPVPARSWQTRQVRKLFKYLVLERGRKVPREQLMEFLWPEVDPRSATASLRVTLSRLRQALAPEGDHEGLQAVMTERDLVWLNPEVLAAVDVFEFTGLIEKARAGAEAGDWTAARQALEGAVALYRGDLLAEDIYEDWTASERERLQLLYLDALLSLAQLYRRVDQGATAAQRARELLRRALAVNPCREDVVRELMDLHLATGQTDEALRVFVKYRDLLQEEYGVGPGPEVLKLAGRAGYREAGRRPSGR